MKKILSLLFAMLMSISLTASATTTSSTEFKNKSELVSVPANLIVKQTITFMDGSTIAVFYKKEGNVCKLYSKNDISKYGASDLLRIKSTNFERTDRVEGKCYASKTASALIAMAKKMLK